MKIPLPPLPPQAVPAGWQWPLQVPPADLQRIIDQQAIVFLEKAPRETWLARQGVLLERLLAFAAQASQPWRERLAGVSATSPHERLAALPVLDRETFRALSAAPLPLPPSHGIATAHSTSGRSGPPVGFHISDHALRIVRHHYAADHLRHGRNLQERRAAIGPRTPPHPGVEHVFSQGNPWMGESHVFTRRGPDFRVEAHAHWLAFVSPAYLSVDPVLLAGMLDAFDGGVPVPRGMKQVITSGAAIAPALRSRTRSLLGASIRDRYACEEVGPVALQCPHDETDEPALHVCVSNAVVEVLNSKGAGCLPGRPGRVVVTGLHHWASPAIRYETGDYAMLAPRCRCGAEVPVLTQVRRAAN
ncbi:MAG: hypothetical protein ABW051_11080 [Burkholderiaceae bacterium]